MKRDCISDEVYLLNEYKFTPEKIAYLVENKWRLHFGVLIKGKKVQIFEESWQRSVEIVDTGFG